MSFEVGLMSKLFKNKTASKHDLETEIFSPQKFCMYHVIFDAIYAFYHFGKDSMHTRLFCWIIMDNSHNLFFLVVSHDKEKNNYDMSDSLISQTFLTISQN